MTGLSVPERSKLNSRKTINGDERDSKRQELERVGGGGGGGGHGHLG